MKEEPQDGGREDRERYDMFPDDPTAGFPTEGAESQGEGSRVTWGVGALNYRFHQDPERNGNESEFSMLNENEV